MNASSNTKKSCHVTIFSFKEKSKYVSVCLELDIIKEGKNMEALLRDMQESVSGYIEAVCKKNLPGTLLNRPAPKKYWKMGMVNSFGCVGAMH